MIDNRLLERVRVANPFASDAGTATGSRRVPSRLDHPPRRARLVRPDSNTCFAPPRFNDAKSTPHTVRVHSSRSRAGHRQCDTAIQP